MNVIALPVRTSTATQTDPDSVLHELLRKAVAAHRSSDMHDAGSPSGRQKNAVSRAYLDAIAIMLEKPGLDANLAHYLSMSVFDIRKLTRIAKTFGTPDAA